MSDFIIVKIERSLSQSGYKPYYLTTSYNIEGKNKSFSTLKALKEYFGIKKIVKRGKGWSINSRGNRIEWNEYEAEVPIRQSAN